MRDEALLMGETKYGGARAATANRLVYDATMAAGADTATNWGDPASTTRGRSSEHPGLVEEAWVRAYQELLRGPVRAMWPFETSGLEHLPEHDDFLLVANHSGLGIVETVVLADAWLSARGRAPLAAMAHPALFRIPGFGELLRAIGAVEATREGAAYARASGAPLLLFPGGDHESMRPLWRAREVDFAGRTGWIRLAREHRLHVVPLAITGSHVTVPNLAGTRTLAWLTGARLFGMRRGPLPVASLIALASSLYRSRQRRAPERVLRAFVAFWGAAFIPWVPSRIGLHMLEPLDVDALEASDQHLYADVTSRIASVLSGEPR
jgi:1-acyl-sn-glycerol-3-phosphate acyltransferase